MRTWLVTTDMQKTNPRMHSRAHHVVVSYVVESRESPSARSVTVDLRDMLPLYEPVVSIVTDITHVADSL